MLDGGITEVVQGQKCLSFTLVIGRYLKMLNILNMIVQILVKDTSVHLCFCFVVTDLDSVRMHMVLQLLYKLD